MSIGLAGWANPPAQRLKRTSAQSHLQYYAAHFRCVEINSSFHRHHRASTYAAWCASTPLFFRFSVKMPRTITHDAGLRDVAQEVDAFFSAIDALRPKLEAILVQLPPSFEFDAPLVSDFFESLPQLSGANLVCEPRHASWFTGAADALLERLGVGRVAADPSKWPDGERPGGDRSFRYFRWHGSPHMYYSSYTEQRLDQFANSIDVETPTWCIFDNTARDAGWNNALAFAAISNASCRQPFAT